MAKKKLEEEQKSHSFCHVKSSYKEGGTHKVCMHLKGRDYHEAGLLFQCISFFSIKALWTRFHFLHRHSYSHSLFLSNHSSLKFNWLSHAKRIQPLENHQALVSYFVLLVVYLNKFILIFQRLLRCFHTIYILECWSIGTVTWYCVSWCGSCHNINTVGRWWVMVTAVKHFNYWV